MSLYSRLALIEELAIELLPLPRAVGPEDTYVSLLPIIAGV